MKKNTPTIFIPQTLKSAQYPVLKKDFFQKIGKKQALFDEFRAIFRFFNLFFQLQTFFSKKYYFSLKIVGIVNRLPLSLIEIQQQIIYWVSSILLISFIQLICYIALFEIRKNLDLRKIWFTPKIFLKSRVYCTRVKLL